MHSAIGGDFGLDDAPVVMIEVRLSENEDLYPY
eukprot:COSAG01_NODE_3273_length_6320_cov_11.772062_7_plen_33_part_00